MDISKYYCDLITQDPINYNGLTIYQPSFEEIKKIGIELYNRIMLIYSLTLDCFTQLPEKENINIFNDLILQDDYLLNCLCESLYILTKADEIILYKKSKNLQLKYYDTKKETISKEVTKEINDIEVVTFKNLLKKWIYRLFGKNITPKKKIINETVTEDIDVKTEKEFIINSSNFDDISDIVLKINANKKAVVEKTPENMSARQRDIWEKLQEGRKREANKNEIHIYDILNMCEYCGDYRIPIEEIKKWSLWRIMNCYKVRTNIKSYEDNIRIALVSGDGKSISGENHWCHQLMIRE